MCWCRGESQELIWLRGRSEIRIILHGCWFGCCWLLVAGRGVDKQDGGPGHEDESMRPREGLRLMMNNSKDVGEAERVVESVTCLLRIMRSSSGVYILGLSSVQDRFHGRGSAANPGPRQVRAHTHTHYRSPPHHLTTLPRP